VLLVIAGLAANQSFAHALWAPLIYLIVTTLQNNLVSPVAYGRGLRLNPTVILFAVMFWFMLWGVAGAFLAVPIIASLRVLARRLPALEPVGILLEG
jgi:predicted PurR-regulated permease PerM